MEFKDFVTLRRQEPFRPFRIMTKDGKTIDAVHPELLMVCTRYLIVGFPRLGSNLPIFETFTRVPYLDIAQVDLLDADKALQTK